MGGAVAVLETAAGSTFSANSASGLGSAIYLSSGAGSFGNLNNAVFTGNSAASGIASVTATANGTAGSYDVAAATGTLAPVNFALTNDPAPNQTNNVPALGMTGLVFLALALSAAGILLVRRIG